MFKSMTSCVTRDDLMNSEVLATQLTSLHEPCVNPMRVTAVNYYQRAVVQLTLAHVPQYQQRLH